jgi:hypothetical protein
MADKPRPLDDKLSKDELEAFYSQDSDRSKAIVLATIVENHLTEAIKISLRPDSAVANELFQPSGPLGNFGTKIRMAYMGGLIGKQLQNDLLIVNKVRNEFAHKLSVKTFEDQPICDWIKNTHVYPLLIGLRDDPARPKGGDEKFRRALKFTLTQSLLTMRDTYRECLRLMIHQLVSIEDGLRENRQKHSDGAKEPPPSNEKS